jgi:hypothetical protein
MFNRPSHAFSYAPIFFSIHTVVVPFVATYAGFGYVDGTNVFKVSGEVKALFDTTVLCDFLVIGSFEFLLPFHLSGVQSAPPEKSERNHEQVMFLDLSSHPLFSVVRACDVLASLLLCTHPHAIYIAA